jgi:N-acetylglucosamine-6-sulfatase
MSGTSQAKSEAIRHSKGEFYRKSKLPQILSMSDKAVKQFSFTGNGSEFLQKTTNQETLGEDSEIRIPLLIRYPKLIKPGRVIDEFALGIDLAPTLLDLAKAPPLSPVDGRSLVPLLKGDVPSDWRTSFLIEYNTETVFPRISNMGYRAIRTRHWKYIQYQDLKGMDEHYDVRHDPYEMQNAIQEPSSAPVLEQLKAELEQILAPKAPQQDQRP